MSLGERITKELTPYLQWDKLSGCLLVILKIVLILAVAYIAVKLFNRLINRALRIGEKTNPRLQTMNRLLQSVTMYMIYFIAGIMILQELNISTASLLASAGIVGLVVGLGAQNLIKDIISGFFIIVEDQYIVGDYIQIGALRGFVNEIGLRTTRLTDWGGEVHMIPNGQIDTVTNHSRANRQATVNVRVMYSENLDRVLEILNQAVAEVKTDLDYIKEGPTVLGIVEFEEAALLIRIVAMTEPMRQWELERVLRARIKRYFDREGIKLPSYFGAPWAKGE